MTDPERLRQVVFFDVGSTLVKSDALPSTMAYARTLDPPVDPEALGRAFEQVLGSTVSLTPPVSVADGIEEWSEAYRRVLNLVGYAGDVQAAIDAMWRFWLEPGELFDDVRETIEALRARGHRLGIISNWAPCLDETLVQLGIGDLFETVVCSSLVGLRKPDPRIFLLAAERLGVGPDSCNHVGDNIAADVDGAISAGMAPILVNRQQARVGKAAPGKQGKDSGRVIRTLKELIA